MPGLESLSDGTSADCISLRYDVTCVEYSTAGVYAAHARSIAQKTHRVDTLRMRATHA